MCLYVSRRANQSLFPEHYDPQQQLCSLETWQLIICVEQTFIALLTALSLPPILFFATFVLSTLLLTLGAAILFTLFWTGVALFLLVPSLFVAAGCAVFLWTWTIGSFITAKWLAQRAGLDFGLGFGSGSSSSSNFQGQVAKTNRERHKTAPLDGGFDVYKRGPLPAEYGVKPEL